VIVRCDRCGCVSQSKPRAGRSPASPGRAPARPPPIRPPDRRRPQPGAIPETGTGRESLAAAPGCKAPIPRSGGAFEQAAALSLHLKPGVLMGPCAGQRRDPLHEIE
jgi:hypothetical protein